MGAMKLYPRLLRPALLAAALLLALGPAHAAPPKPLTFPRAFAPSEGWVKAPERPLRQEECLNGSWRFQPVAVPTGWKRDVGAAPDLTPPIADGWEKTALKVPSPWNVNAFNRDGGGDFRCYPSYPKAWDNRGNGLDGAVVPRPGGLARAAAAPAL